MTKVLHLMLDLETLSTRSDAEVLSIGISPVGCFEYRNSQKSFKFLTVKPSEDKVRDVYPNEFYRVLPKLGQENRNISESTKLFWLSQPKELTEHLSSERLKLKEENVHVKDVLKDLGVYFQKLQFQFAPCTFCMWSNGASFDIPILNHLLKEQDLPVPWSYRNERCYRTVLDWASGTTDLNFHHVKHHALSDARWQANNLEWLGLYNQLEKTSQRVLGL